MKQNKIGGFVYVTRQLANEDGTGYLIEFPDLPGCISDGDTLEEAIENGRDAMECWINAAKKAGRVIPKPTEF